ncbi:MULTISPECIES: TIGR02300 family protein [Phyllobacteriaceae]|uniref:TIGR02300 family protein n=1 Tax=Phyllobacteriaceae TaxID=69277 RepID=UPI002ACA335B|nr:TIGR02300 family protein [Chelativorans sp. M5D2P16]MDZ5697299.1 TIGR02300 family protein [Chelativorans sp. M5D2P16]
MAKPELGTKRICPETGRKFYDLNRDPIVSPYTGQSYPRSYFESTAEIIEEEEAVEDKELSEDGPEVVSLEDADEETKSGSTDLPDVDEEDVDLGGETDDTFLEEEEEGDDDVKDIIGVSDDDDER